VFTTSLLKDTQKAFEVTLRHLNNREKRRWVLR